MRKITDLTLPIVEHWRYGIKFELATSHANKDRWQTTKYNLQSHWFTHIDAPVHHDPDGKNLDAYPISDWCISDCLILDLSFVGDNEAITAQMLERANEPFKDKHYDTIIIRSDRGRKVSWESVEFWSALTEEGGSGTIIRRWSDLTSRKIMKYAKSVLQNQRILSCSRYMISF